MARVEGEDAGVTVALARKRGQPHQLDEQLVRLELGSASHQLVGGRIEVLARDGVEEIWMDRLHLLRERANVALDAGDGRGWSPCGARRRDSDDGRKREYAGAHHRPALAWS